jgi:hypothetical protein
MVYFSKGRKRMQKVQWLLRHPELWHHWQQDTWKNQSEWLGIVKIMKEDGVVGRNTAVLDVCMWILIEIAREVETQRDVVVPFRRR